MQTAIQRFPRALLTLLGAQANGSAPRVLGEQVVPVLDLLDLYGVPEVVDGQNAAASAVGDQAARLVVANEFWYVKSIGLRATVSNAATVVSAFAGVQHQAGQLPAHYAVTNVETPGAVGSQVAAGCADVNVLLAPGAQLIAQLLRPAGAGTISLTVTALVYRFV